MEQLYPFPDAALREVIWLQEELRNMGAWSYMAPRLRDLCGRVPSIAYIGRPERASPAAGSSLLHRAEQGRIVAEAFSGLQGLQEPSPIITEGRTMAAAIRAPLRGESFAEALGRG